MRFGARAKSLQDSGFKATGACPAETEGSRFVEGHERFCFKAELAPARRLGRLRAASPSAPVAPEVEIWSGV